MIRVAVVILNWNGRGMLERFLPSVVDYSVSDESLSVSVVVADNGSSDDSVVFMREYYPQVQLVLLDKTYGFAEGYNRALAQVEADYYVLLNSDVECTQHWIAPVVAMMERDPQVAIAQPKLMMYDQKDTFEYAGGAWSRITASMTTNAISFGPLAPQCSSKLPFFISWVASMATSSPTWRR